MKIIDKIKRFIFEFECKWFDYVNDIHTFGFVNVENLVTDSDFKSNARPFMSVWIKNVRKVIYFFKSSELKNTTFIDIGCGKGRACFYATKQNKFVKTIGIDLCEDLINNCLKNKLSFEKKNEAVATNLFFLNDDATTFMLPDEKCLVFMFNPFDGVVLEKFILNNLANIKRNNSYIAYINDVHRNVLLENSFNTVFDDSLNKISIWSL